MSKGEMTLDFIQLSKTLQEGGGILFTWEVKNGGTRYRVTIKRLKDSPKDTNI